jgi:hypothetical protein
MGRFGMFGLMMLALDLGVLHCRAHVVNVKEVLRWNAPWIILALFFNPGLSPA